MVSSTKTLAISVNPSNLYPVSLELEEDGFRFGSGGYEGMDYFRGRGLKPVITFLEGFGLMKTREKRSGDLVISGDDYLDMDREKKKRITLQTLCGCSKSFCVDKKQHIGSVFTVSLSDPQPYFDKNIDPCGTVENRRSFEVQGLLRAGKFEWHIYKEMSC